MNLLEMALVLAVMGMVYSASVPLVSSVQDTAHKAKTETIMQDLEAKLLNYASLNYRLPCPAPTGTSQGDANHGVEDCTLDPPVGVLPHVTLVLDQEAWDSLNRQIVYSVYRNANATLSDDADLAVAANRVDYVEDTDLINIGDFCTALENGNTSDTTARTSISTYVDSATVANGCTNGQSASFSNQAYVLASSGVRDADEDGSDIFDGLNADATTTCFAGPDQGWDNSYDDMVRAVSFATLLGQLCQ